MSYDTTLTREALKTAIARVAQITADAKVGDQDNMVEALNDIREVVEAGFNDYRQAVALEQRNELAQLRTAAAKINAPD